MFLLNDGKDEWNERCINRTTIRRKGTVPETVKTVTSKNRKKKKKKKKKKRLRQISNEKTPIYIKISGKNDKESR